MVISYGILRHIYVQDIYFEFIGMQKHKFRVLIE